MNSYIGIFEHVYSEMWLLREPLGRRLLASVFPFESHIHVEIASELRKLCALNVPINRPNNRLHWNKYRLAETISKFQRELANRSVRVWQERYGVRDKKKTHRLYANFMYLSILHVKEHPSIRRVANLCVYHNLPHPIFGFPCLRYWPENVLIYYHHNCVQPKSAFQCGQHWSRSLHFKWMRF